MEFVEASRFRLGPDRVRIPICDKILIRVRREIEGNGRSRRAQVFRRAARKALVFEKAAATLGIVGYEHVLTGRRPFCVAVRLLG